MWSSKCHKIQLLGAGKSSVPKRPWRYHRRIGVPQGSPISATLANIYMLSADKQLHEYVTSFGGFYMRYSDDFMIVLPDKGDSVFPAQYAQIKAVLALFPNWIFKIKRLNCFMFRIILSWAVHTSIFPHLKTAKTQLIFSVLHLTERPSPSAKRRFQNTTTGFTGRRKRLCVTADTRRTENASAAKSCMRNILTRERFPIRSAKRLNTAVTFHARNSAGISSTTLNVRNMFFRESRLIVVPSGTCKKYGND